MTFAALIVAALAVDAGAPQPPPDLDPLVFGAPEVSAAASPSEVRLGQPITVVVTAIYGAGVEVNLPDPLVLGDAFEAGHREASDRVRTDGRHVREWQIKVYPWELGEMDIPPLPVTFTAGGRAATVPTLSIPVRVVGVLGDTDDPKLMRASAQPVPLWRRSWLLAWLAGGGATTLAIFIYFAFFHRRRKLKPKHDRPAGARLEEAPVATAAPQETADDDQTDGDPVREPPPPPPVVIVPRPATIVRARRKLDRLAEEALARLRAIETSGRLDTDRKRAYREMVEVIRWYLGARYGVDAAELTTRELCAALTFRSAEAAGLTRAWLADCDLVKYANRSATGDEARGVLDGACWLVDRTSPGAPPAQAAHA